MKQLNWHQIFGKSNIPDGRTVLPTDDIQIWLHCANIWGKTYTTLAEVLADTDTLSALIASENAVDYMVRSTTWAVATALVPTMTSDTTPEGECFAGQGMSASEPAWKAFDGLTTTRAGASAGATELSVGYKPVNPIKPYKAYIWSAYSGNYQYKVQYSDNGSTWTDACSYVVVTNSNPYISLSVDAQHSYWRIIRKWSSADSGIVRELQFYSISITDSSTAMTYIGLNNYAANTLLADATWCDAILSSDYWRNVINAEVPVMTSDTTPSGVCSSSSVYTDDISTYGAWRAFDGNDIGTSPMAHTQQLAHGWIQYQFTEPVVIKMIHYKGQDTYWTSRNPSGYLQGSNDGVTYDNIKAINYRSAQIIDDVIENTNSYDRYRLYNSSSSPEWLTAATIQFYGRKDV